MQGDEVPQVKPTNPKSVTPAHYRQEGNGSKDDECRDEQHLIRISKIKKSR